MLTEPMMEVTVGCETNKWPGPDGVDGINPGGLKGQGAVEGQPNGPS